MLFKIGNDGAKEVNLSSTRKPPKRAASKRWEDSQPGMASLILGMSISALIYVSYKAIAQWQTKVEGLDMTLDNPADYADTFWLMVRYECVILGKNLCLGPLVL